MAQLLAAFGIDWRLLVINIINFGALLWALWYFLYGPLTRMLDERRAHVAQGVLDAEQAALRLKEVEESRGALLAQAGKEADAVMAEARSAAGARERESAAAAAAAAARTLDDAKREAQEMKNRAIEESKKEVAKLVVLGMEKLSLEKGR